MAEPKLYTQSRMMVPATEPNHLVTLGEVEEMLEGTRWNPADAATSENLDASYADQLLTANANGALPAIDGVTLAVGDRVLVWRQADKSQNGIYEVASLGDASSPWEMMRTSDANADNEFLASKRVQVNGGDSYGGKPFKQITGTAVVLGSTPIEFALDVDTEVVRSETLEIVGDGSATEFTLTHTINTRSVRVVTYDEQGGEVEFGKQVISASSVKLTAGIAIPSGEKFTVVIMGMPD